MTKRPKKVTDQKAKEFALAELSVFLPAYNEEANIERTVKNVKDNLNKVAKDWEIIIINDGSKDNTGKIADKLHKEDSRIRPIHHNPNRGYGGAVKSGLYGAKYDWISFIDADGQFDFAEISELIKKQKNTRADMVIGYYLKRQVPTTVILTSKIWEAIVFILFGLHVKDIDCGFKLISKKIVDKIPKLEAERGAFISSELLIKTKKAGFKIVEIGVHHYPRKEGKPTGRNLRVILKSFSDLFRLWRKLR